jgi:hypothetical protein
MPYRDRGPVRPLRLMVPTGLSVLLIVGLALAASPAASVAAIQKAGKNVTFSSPSVVDPVHDYGEPDIRIASDGTVYDSGPWGTGTQRSVWERSVDGGATFVPVHSPAVSTAAQSVTNVPCPSGVGQCPGGGDTEIAIDHTGKVYYADLAALVSLKTATWDPGSTTLQTGFQGDPQQDANGYDRQWFAMWDPPSRPDGYTGPLPVNYLVYLEAVLGSDPHCSTANCEAASYSTDGLTYATPTTAYDVGVDGNAVVDQKTGTVLEAIGYSSLSDVGVSILTRDPGTPADPSLVNVQKVKIADLPSGMSNRGLFPVIAMDAARNAYVVWVTRCDCSESTDPDAWQIFYSYSTATSGWTTWSQPVQISAAPANTNLMPWITAGSDGRVAAVWYGSADTTHNPSTEDAHQSWDVYLASITNADSAHPAVSLVKVTRHPMHYGTICLEGTGCIASQGNRNLADFFQDTVDPRDGAVVITYNDTSNESLQEFVGTGDGTADHRGAPLVLSVRQNGGVGLFGTTVKGAPRAGASMSDQAGDARFDPIYGTTSVPGLDLRGFKVSMKGSNVDVRFTVQSLKDQLGTLAATGAGAIDYVARWTGPPIDDPNTGTRNPIYFVAVEVGPGGTPAFFAGEALAVELCSVSGCFPHIIDYPAPPRGGTAVTGEQLSLKHGRGAFVVHVPAALIGVQPQGALLESFSAFTFARLKSAAIPFTNAEAEADISPIEIDGICCRDVKLRP